MTKKKHDDDQNAGKAHHDHKQSEAERLAQEAGELKNTLQRLQAEFDNYRKRCDRENASFVRHANESLMKGLLPILDNFELALAHHKEDDEFHKGVKLIYAQFFGALEANGLRRIECLGQKFDPYYHEVLLSEESDKEPNTVLEELQKGYLFGDKVLRHSKVKIAKGPSASEKNDDQAPPVSDTASDEAADDEKKEGTD